METKLKLLLGTMVIALMAIMTGCTSTDVIDSPKGEERKSNEITLNMVAPIAGKNTRADNDHKLRYSALLYDGNQLLTTKFLERKEAIASDDGGATITFQVPVGTYTFSIIGDYIPSNAEPDANGHYTDTYYDTKPDNDKGADKIFMRSFKDFATNTAIDYKCINNENYDCFAYSFTVVKEETEIVKDLSLDRIVSRVSFVSTTPALDDEIEEIKFTNFDFYYHYNLSNNKAGSHANSPSAPLPAFSIKPMDIDQTQKEVFFFYTLAPLSNSLDNVLGDIEFTVNYKNSTSPHSVSTHGKKIEPLRNYKIIIKGAFLSEPEPQKGDIILNLSANQNWNDN